MNGLLLALLLLQTPATLQSQNGSLTGRVRRQDEQPASGLRIAAMAAPEASTNTTSASGVLASLAETDAEGRYRLENLPPGRYYIIAGLVDFPTYYPGVTNVAGARIVEVTARRALEGMDFSLQRPTSVKVSGRLTISGAGFRLALAGQRGARSPEEIAVKEDGTFEFPNVFPGEYLVRLSGAYLEPRSENLQVDSVPLTDLVIGARPVAVVEGRVLVVDATGNRIPDPLRLLVSFERTRGGRQTPVRGDSTFGLQLVEGEHAVSMNNLPEGYLITSITSGSVNLKDETLKIIGTKRPADIQITLKYSPPR